MSNHEHSLFFRAMMTGLFVGIVDTIICLTYNILYRNYTGFVPSIFINVSSLIFAVNLLLLVVGIIFYGFLTAFRKGDIVFTVVFAAITIFLTWKAEGIVRFSDARPDAEFRGLLAGIILIVGISSACLPFLLNSRKFEEFIL